jgi:hypothetical protein
LLGEGSGGGSGGAGEGPSAKHERSFFTSSFFRGLAVGLLVAVAAIAVVATAGAALAIVAPAASAAIAASGVGTAIAVAGGTVAAANIVQSVRQRDLFNNPISEDQANYNLGLGFGSLGGGALARPISGGAGALVQGVSQGAENISASSGLLVPALEGAGSLGGAISTPATGAIPLSIPATIGASAGSTVLMMSGRGSGGDDEDFGSDERIGRPGRNRPGNNQVQNEQVKALARKYGLSKSEQRQFHNYIQDEDLDFAGLEDALRGFFPNKIPR